LTDSDLWPSVLEAFEREDVPLPAGAEPLFGPLRRGSVDPLVVIGQIGQSLDGRIATASGHSHYVNGPSGLTHLHRLRALVDAIVVGIGTVLADDPQLTVRRVAGRQPARVVIDPRGRLPAHARLLADGARRIVLTAGATRHDFPAGVEIGCLPAESGAIAPHTILRTLHEYGFRRVLIEGGAHTVSRFLAAGGLDRLHVVVAPVIIGDGPTGLILPPIAHMDEALRPPVRVHQLGDELLFDCDLSAHRIPFGQAKKSM
jgi:diaminohydroxyphosphoribosylaminopyrimidine deaminase/5-amino-6-(5-phosphoribosylamino)uracil reductase